MSLQLHTENTVIVFYVITEEGNRKAAEVDLSMRDHERGIVGFNVTNNNGSTSVVAYHNQEFIIPVQHECEYYEARCRAYLNDKDGRIWLSIDADKKRVYIGRYRKNV